MMNLDNHNIVRSEKVKQFKLSNEVIQNKNIILLGRSHAEDIWLSFKYNENLFSEYNFIFTNLILGVLFIKNLRINY